MEPIFDSDRDILLSYDLDIDFESGDLMVCEGRDYLIRKVFKLLVSEIGDWKLDGQVFGNPSRFIGEKNNRETAQRLKSFLIQKIQPYVSPVQVDVRVVPINYDSVKVYLDLVFYGDIIGNIPFTLDFINGITYTQIDPRVDKIFSTNKIKLNAPGHIVFPNTVKDIISKQ